MFPPKQSWLPCALFLLLCGGQAFAQPDADDGVLTLKQAFDLAWQRQPEALALAQRQAAALAGREVASSWSAEPLAIVASTEGDQLNGNAGAREHSLGLAIPLWLPGERQRAGALADAQIRAVDSRALDAQLRTAAAVREGYWRWQRARQEALLGEERLEHARKLAADVARRLAAGELARADQHQADAALAQAEIEQTGSQSALALARQRLHGLTGATPNDAADGRPEAMPQRPAELSSLDSSHPQIRALLDQADTARQAAELSRQQRQGNPELTLATTRSRDPGDGYDQAISIGLRVPFGSGSRSRLRQSSADADAIEAEAQARLERQRLQGEVALAQLQLETAERQAEAAQRRSQLASESRVFMDKAFRLGEIDLPTRLLAERDAADARRQHALALLDQAAAVSTLRQALGLLPE